VRSCDSSCETDTALFHSESFAFLPSGECATF